MLITPEPGIMSTIKIRYKKGGSFHYEAVPLSETAEVIARGKRFGRQTEASNEASLASRLRTGGGLGGGEVDRVKRGG